MIQQSNQNIFFPKWMSNKAIVIYFVSLLIVSALYSQFAMPWYYVLSGVVAVLVFFYFSNTLSKKWIVDNSFSSEKRFVRRIFWISFILRFFWMTMIYIIFQNEYGDAFGFEDGDPTYYNDAAKNVASLIREGDFQGIPNIVFKTIDVSDAGFATYLGIIYSLTDDSIYISRIIKCILSAWTVLMMCKLAKTNFGLNAGRITAVFCMLWPNFWYYCGTSLKETEMVFLSVLFVLQADEMLRTRNFSAWKIVPLLLIAGVLFTFRTVLALLCVLCLLFAIVMSSTKVIGWGKRILIGIISLGLVGVTMGNSIQEQAKELIEEAESDQQQKNMEWRSKRENGNQFAKYASKTVFAPLIFTIPFPTMVRPFEGQENQQLLNGGNYIKNVASFFVILSMFMLLFNGNWRNHLLPLSFVLGYMVILAMSKYAQSERFHQPAMPFELMFAAYGIVQVIRGVPISPGVGNKRQYRRWFNIWIGFMLVADITWNWFKLAGRGLI